MCLSNYFKRRKVNTNRIFKTSYVPSKSLQELRGSDQVLKKWMRFFKNKKRKKHQRSSKPKLDIKLQYRKPICYNNIYIVGKQCMRKLLNLTQKRKVYCMLYVIYIPHRNLNMQTVKEQRNTRQTTQNEK